MEEISVGSSFSSMSDKGTVGVALHWFRYFKARFFIMIPIQLSSFSGSRNESMEVKIRIKPSCKISCAVCRSET